MLFYILHLQKDKSMHIDHCCRVPNVLQVWVPIDHAEAWLSVHTQQNTVQKRTYVFDIQSQALRIEHSIHSKI